MNTIRKQDLFAVWILLVVVLGVDVIASWAAAWSAFYQQVIKHEPYGIRSIQLHVTPDMFRPTEGFDRCRSYCSARKATVPRLPDTVTV
jgi:hypothetical protein